MTYFPITILISILVELKNYAIQIMAEKNGFSLLRLLVTHVSDLVKLVQSNQPPLPTQT